MTTPADRNTQAPLTRRQDDGGSPAHSDPMAEATRYPRGNEFPADRDLVRWGPLWAGVLITLASFLVLQLAIFAADLFNDGGDAGTWLTVTAGLLAFFLGGLVAGACALWHKVTHGLLNGALMWALATVGLLLLAVAGGGTLLGPISTVAADLGQIQELNLQNVPTEQVNDALDGARGAAGWSLLGLLLSLLASATGGALGATMWPSRASKGPR